MKSRKRIKRYFKKFERSWKKVSFLIHSINLLFSFTFIKYFFTAYFPDGVAIYLKFISFLLRFYSSGAQSGVISPTSTSAQHNNTTLRMPPPTSGKRWTFDKCWVLSFISILLLKSGGINEPQECPYCRRTFSCYYSLKRHFQDKHEQSDTLYVCEFCHRRYRTKNSLTTHKSLQHRGSSGMLKRLLKTSAIKNVLGPHVPQHTRPHLFDFAAELGQPPPGIPQ